MDATPRPDALPTSKPGLAVAPQHRQASPSCGRVGSPLQRPARWSTLLYDADLNASRGRWFDASPNTVHRTGSCVRSRVRRLGSLLHSVGRFTADLERRLA